MFSITKKCTKCGGVKPLSEFHKDKGMNDGHTNRCKVCACQAGKKWRLDNLERQQEYDRKRWKNEQEKISARNRRWREENTDKLRESKKTYRINNAEKVNDGQKKWRLANPEKKKANGKAWYLANIEKLRARAREWAGNNLPKRAEYNQNRRAMKAGNGGTITAHEWQEMKEKYNYTCLCCGRREPEIKITLDHVMPLKLGGSNTIGNAQPLCFSCNASKRANYVDYR